MPLSARVKVRRIGRTQRWIRAFIPTVSVSLDPAMNADKLRDPGFTPRPAHPSSVDGATLLPWMDYTA